MAGNSLLLMHPVACGRARRALMPTCARGARAQASGVCVCARSTQSRQARRSQCKGPYVQFRPRHQHPMGAEPQIDSKSGARSIADRLATRRQSGIARFLAALGFLWWLVCERVAGCAAQARDFVESVSARSAFHEVVCA